MTHPVEWYEGKANAVVRGWRAIFEGRTPSRTAVELVLAVAIHETIAGDAWPGEYNWGAIQARVLTAGEKAALAGLPASLANVAEARSRLAAAAAAGTIQPPTRKPGVADSGGVALHVDSSPLLPRPGWYWVFFVANEDDAAGAAVLVHILAEQRASCRAVLEDPNGSARALADAMYRTRYYEGVHDPRQPGGAEANVTDYASALARHLVEIRAALTAGEWTAPVVHAPLTPALARWWGTLSAISHGTALEGLDAVDAVVADTDPAPPLAS